ncbi:ABC transporter substrate-binding protein [Mesorhizobium australicum]|uniref:ABC transporter substrate-binding protein n=1 Tax=Mesorhizobium australicum TaxID=536018 RepID=UPI003338785D
MKLIQNRRTFLTGLSAIGGAGLLNVRPSSAAGEPALETTTVRLGQWVGGAYCWASIYLAGELLRADGFTDIQYVEGDTHIDNSKWLAAGLIDFDMNMPSMHIKSVDAGVPVKVLIGVHSGCFELIGNDSVSSIRDLRGKRVGGGSVESHPHILTALMANYVGLDPVHDIEWVEGEQAPMQMFIDGKVDAYMAGPPEPQILHARKIGHTIVNNGTDRPWSQYFCCMVAGNADYVSRYPVATKRVLRAILKSADLCASDPSLAAQQLVDRGFLPNYDEALGTLNGARHDKWRVFDAEDSVRFYALRMQETGMIKSTPQQILANGTDWRFLNELKRELKA